MIRTAVLALAWLHLPFVAVAGGGDAIDILDTDSYWRWDKLCRPAVLALAPGPAAPAQRMTIQGTLIDAALAEGVRADFPADWTERGFDDRLWARTRASLLDGLAFSGLDTSVVVMRGKFGVSDPAAVKRLDFSASYRGGVVAYLNGQEVARAGMPPGPVTPATPAEPYGDAIFLDDDGRPYKFPNNYQVGLRIRKGDKDLARRINGRTRSVGSVQIPTAALRKGVNVLAVAVHRSDYHASARSWKNNKHAAWLPCALPEVRLTALGSGITPNVGRPDGVQVWNADINDRTTVLDYGDPNEKLLPIRIAAARNGFFSGKVVVGSARAIRGLRAQSGPLKHAEGRGGVPASAARVRYALPDGSSARHPPWFDALAEAAPREVTVNPAGGGAVQPIWVTVRIPPGAAAGDYRGTLTISAERIRPVEVPVHLHVAGWTIPELTASRTYCGVYQSPTTLALKYKVKLWSEPHWKLIEESFALLGQLGSDIVNIPLSEQTQFGNDEGMVRWIRKPGGGFDYDLTAFDRYMKLAKKHLVAPDFVVLHLWHAAGWEHRGVKQRNTVTVINPAGGGRESMQVPQFGTPASEAFWRPALHALRDRLGELGLAEKMCLGVLSDATAPPEVFAVFNRVLPDTRWARFSHVQTRSPGPMPLRGGGRIVLQEHVYDLQLADPARELPAIWDTAAKPGAAFFRSEFDDRLSMLGYRTVAERALFCNKRGFGRVCLDFWAVPGGTKRGDLNNRWPHSSVAQRSPVMLRLAAPGPDGPIPTVRFEAMRESIQDAEALIVVAEALDTHAGKLGADLAGRCRKILLDRLVYCRQRNVNQWRRVFFHVNHRGWQEMSARLYELAGEVTAGLAGIAAR